MKRFSHSRTRKGFLTAATALAVLAFAGCKKTDKEKYAAPYVGTWKGVSCGGAGTYIINKGDDDMSIKLDFGVGADSTCLAKKILIGRADENNINFENQYFTDECNVVWTVNGIGTISHDTLTMTFNISGTYKLVKIQTTCTFVGHK